MSQKCVFIRNVIVSVKEYLETCHRFIVKIYLPEKEKAKYLY